MSKYSSSSSSSSSGSNGLGVSGVLLIVFIVLKLIGVIEWSWWWVMSPLWISVLVVLAIAIPIAIYRIIKASSDK